MKKHDPRALQRALDTIRNPGGSVTIASHGFRTRVPEWRGTCSHCKATTIVQPTARTKDATDAFTIDCPNCEAGDGVRLVTT